MFSISFITENQQNWQSVNAEIRFENDRFEQRDMIKLREGDGYA